MTTMVKTVSEHTASISQRRTERGYIYRYDITCTCGKFNRSTHVQTSAAEAYHFAIRLRDSHIDAEEG